MPFSLALQTRQIFCGIRAVLAGMYFAKQLVLLRVMGWRVAPERSVVTPCNVDEWWTWFRLPLSHPSTSISHRQIVRARMHTALSFTPSMFPVFDSWFRPSAVVLLPSLCFLLSYCWDMQCLSLMTRLTVLQYLLLLLTSFWFYQPFAVGKRGWNDNLSSLPSLLQFASSFARTSPTSFVPSSSARSQRAVRGEANNQVRISQANRQPHHTMPTRQGRAGTRRIVHRTGSGRGGAGSQCIVGAFRVLRPMHLERTP